jgi:hypothetical protein
MNLNDEAFKKFFTSNKLRDKTGNNIHPEFQIQSSFSKFSS